MASNLLRCRHIITELNVHLVFVTKYRKKVFDKEGLDFLQATMKDTAKKMGFKVLEFDGEPDYVHLLITYPPKYSISKLVNHLKGVSSRMYRKEFNFNGTHLWSPSYFASSVGGAPIEVLKQYINRDSAP
ncbi:MAG: IS200/IS605 family transposase [Crocosphaera sp.]